MVKKLLHPAIVGFLLAVLFVYTSMVIYNPEIFEDNPELPTEPANSDMQATEPTEDNDLVAESQIVVDEYVYDISEVDEEALSFAVSHPDVGPYCNGCFGGWPSSIQQDNVYGSSISGTYNSSQGPVQDDLDWRLTAGIIEEIDPSDERIDEQAVEDMRALTAAAPGETVPVVASFWTNWLSAEGGPYTSLVRRDVSPSPDSNQDIRLFVSPDGEVSYAILPLDGAWALVSYQHKTPEYDMFPEIVSSFRMIDDGQDL